MFEKFDLKLTSTGSKLINRNYNIYIYLNIFDNKELFYRLSSEITRMFVAFSTVNRHFSTHLEQLKVEYPILVYVFVSSNRDEEKNHPDRSNH